MSQKMLTPIIKYNLKNRMRQFNGVERNFNIPKLVASINSNQVQERVKLGDLHGFYGHWSRIKFGAEPQEGGVVDGKVVNLEPCFRTVYLKAYDDGTVEHQQEFFPNESGKKAFALLEAKVGGFSSVITMNNGEFFHGFDYVREPNFSGNRPYTLDSTTSENMANNAILVLDDATETAEWKAYYIECLLDSIKQLENDKTQLQQENHLLAETIDKLTNEQVIMLDDIVMLKNEIKNKDKAVSDFSLTMLDNAIAEAEAFKTARIEKIDEPLSQAEKEVQATRKLLSQWGF